MSSSLLQHGDRLVGVEPITLCIVAQSLGPVLRRTSARHAAGSAARIDAQQGPPGSRGKTTLGRADETGPPGGTGAHSSSSIPLGKWKKSSPGSGVGPPIGASVPSDCTAKETIVLVSEKAFRA